MKTVTLSSEAFANGIGISSVLSFRHQPLSSRPLSVPRFYPFAVVSKLNLPKLFKPFRIKQKDSVVSLIDNIARSKKMLGGFYRMDRVFADRDVVDELYLLSQQTGFNIRPGTALEFLYFIQHRNCTLDNIPEISVILGNLLFSLCFTKHFFELDTIPRSQEMHQSMQVFCVQELE